MIRIFSVFMSISAEPFLYVQLSFQVIVHDPSNLSTHVIVVYQLHCLFLAGW